MLREGGREMGCEDGREVDAGREVARDLAGVEAFAAFGDVICGC